MPDILKTQGAPDPEPLTQRIDDMGDGTHALVRSTGAYVDPVRRALCTHPYTEARINAGMSFFTGYSTPLGEKIDDDDPLDFVIITGNRRLNGVATWFSGGDFQLFFYEGIAEDGDGVEIPAINRKRSSLITSAATFFLAPTITDFGTTLVPGRWVLGGAAGLAETAIAEFAQKWILKTNTKYLMRMINRSTLARRMGLTIPYYEEIINV